MKGTVVQTAEAVINTGGDTSHIPRTFAHVVTLRRQPEITTAHIEYGVVCNSSEMRFAAAVTRTFESTSTRRNDLETLLIRTVHNSLGTSSSSEAPKRISPGRVADMNITDTILFLMKGPSQPTSLMQTDLHSVSAIWQCVS